MANEISERGLIELLEPEADLVKEMSNAAPVENTDAVTPTKRKERDENSPNKRRGRMADFRAPVPTCEPKQRPSADDSFWLFPPSYPSNKPSPVPDINRDKVDQAPVPASEPHCSIDQYWLRVPNLPIYKLAGKPHQGRGNQGNAPEKSIAPGMDDPFAEFWRRVPGTKNEFEDYYEI